MLFIVFRDLKPMLASCCLKLHLLDPAQIGGWQTRPSMLPSRVLTGGFLLYSMIGFQWRADKFFWFYFYIFMRFVYFTSYGAMLVALTPNYRTAAISMSFSLGPGICFLVSSLQDWKFLHGGGGIIGVLQLSKNSEKQCPEKVDREI